MMPTKICVTQNKGKNCSQTTLDQEITSWGWGLDDLLL